MNGWNDLRNQRNSIAFPMDNLMMGTDESPKKMSGEVGRRWIVISGLKC